MWRISEQSNEEAQKKRQIKQHFDNDWQTMNTQIQIRHSNSTYLNISTNFRCRLIGARFIFIRSSECQKLIYI